MGPVGHKLCIATRNLLFMTFSFALLFAACSKEEQVKRTVKVARTTIVEKALAVGTIEPENEISVKSKISGVVEELYADVGDFVKMGAPLLEIKPDPTPLELAEAKRNVEMAEIEYANAAKEKQRLQELQAKNLISQKEFDATNRLFEEADLKLKMARERLALIETGKVK
ncbi:MAG: biotin/lipoyl-binding protein, partial [Calditrichaeota bacterium]